MTDAKTSSAAGASPATVPDPDAAVASSERAEREREMIVAARRQGPVALAWTFVKLSGPGWLQSAITLGGGSLGGSLYLGVIAGFGMMWIQPMAMVLGVIMLSAIGYVTLSTGERPFQAVNKHVNPVLGWGWALATMMANFVWCMPQFSLGTAAIQQNLAPETFGPPAVVRAIEEAGGQTLSDSERASVTASTEFKSKLICSAILFIAGFSVVWFYNSGGWGIRLFEWILKGMVGIVVVSFFAVVAKMSASGALDWGEILSGFIPDFSLLSQPGAKLRPLVDATGDFAEFWRSSIVKSQNEVMITAVATAVGINMTFLLPYSMLSKGWNKEFRGLAIFDLSTGLVIPYVVATGCVVLAAAAQFHAKPETGLVALYNPAAESVPADAPPLLAKLVSGYDSLLDNRLKQQPELKAEVEQLLEDADGGSADAITAAKARLKELRSTLPVADLTVAAALAPRDNQNFADSLSRLVGKETAQGLFGVGVLGMAVSTIIILMLINGFVVCEMLGLPPKGTPHRLAAAAAGLVGALGPFFWGKAAAYLVVPTSMFGLMLLPIAYWTFFFMMNSKSLMGSNMPQGFAKVRWNVLMIIASSAATFGSLWSIFNSRYQTELLSALGAFIALAVIVHFVRRPGDAHA
ncbi:MAG: divalent metal cation transporter [Planctomycetaceae bacterium]